MSKVKLKGIAQHRQDQRPNLALERKIESITADLTPSYSKQLLKLSLPSEENALTICNYIQAMKTEVNPSKQYKQSIIEALCYLSRFHSNRIPFTKMSRDDVIMYLNSLHKSESEDPQHRFKGTYNYRLVCFIRFFKWLYSPDNSPDTRATPAVMQNIPRLRRKEITTIKPSDLWTEEDDALFLKYCDNKRDKAYHTISRDSSCRPSEILGLKIKDLNFMLTVDKKQYAQITVNGKTGTRNIPLFSCIPYIKDWISSGHPTAGNPNAYLIPSLDSNHGIVTVRGHKMQSASIRHIYRRYQKITFPKLLENPGVPPEDKIKIRELINNRKWNPYIRRHSGLTQKAQKLTAPVLKQYAGWQPGSEMDSKYIHFLGNEANDTILSEIYGLETAATLKSKKLSQALTPKVCPNCSESNIPDCKFCSKCKMILTYDAYEETIQSAQQKDDEIKTIKEQIQALILAVSSMKDQNQVNNFTHQLFNAGILQVSKSSPEK
jgi:integrase/recombinase XerD